MILRASGDGLRHIVVPGHFGELLQGRLGPDGPVALLTLPCPALRLYGQWSPGAFALFQPGQPILQPAQVVQLLRLLDLPVTGQFTLRAEMPLGGGAGSSTAALVAIARLAGHPRAEARALAAATVAVEGASDPLMFRDPARLIWASRQARILTMLPALPRFDVLGGFFGPAVRTDPRDDRFADIADLAAALPLAIRSAAALAELASESAQRSLIRRSADHDPTAALARDLGALGIAIAHTGPARALLFAPGTAPVHAKSALIEAGFRRLTAFRPTA